MPHIATNRGKRCEASTTLLLRHGADDVRMLLSDYGCVCAWLSLSLIIILTGILGWRQRPLLEDVGGAPCRRYDGYFCSLPIIVELGLARGATLLRLAWRVDVEPVSRDLRSKI